MKLIDSATGRQHLKFKLFDNSRGSVGACHSIRLLKPGNTRFERTVFKTYCQHVFHLSSTKLIYYVDSDGFSSIKSTSKVPTILGGRIAQWIAFSLCTQQPRVNSRRSQEIFSWCCWDLLMALHWLVRGQWRCLIVDRIHLVLLDRLQKVLTNFF